MPFSLERIVPSHGRSTIRASQLVTISAMAASCATRSLSRFCCRQDWKDLDTDCEHETYALSPMSTATRWLYSD